MSSIKQDAACCIFNSRHPPDRWNALKVPIAKGSLRMEHLKVALLQLIPEETMAGNLQKGLEYCRRAKEMGAHIASIRRLCRYGCAD